MSVHLTIGAVDFMTFKIILRFIILPLLALSIIAVLIFHKPIIRSWTFDHYFDRMVQHYGRSVITRYGDKIIGLGSYAEDPLIEKAKTSKTSPAGRRLALYLLGRIKSEKAVPLLLEYLGSNDANLRLGAVQGLKHMMKPEYVSSIGPLSSDPVELIRDNVASCLGRVATPESIQWLQHIVKSERTRTIWYRAWQSLRFIQPVDGVVVEKFRMDKELRLIPEGDNKNEVVFTYYFVKVKNNSDEYIVNLTWLDYRHLRIGDHIYKDSMSDTFSITQGMDSAS
jgi:hypothetical protein